MENTNSTIEKSSSRFKKLFSFLKKILGGVFQSFKKTSLQSLENKLNLIVSLMLKGGIIALLIAFGLILYREVNNKNYTLTHIHVPRLFEAKGYNSTVIANKLMDEVKSIKRWGRTQKNTKDLSGSIDRSLMDVQIMGVGFSMSALIYHTKKLVGIMPREISGELVMKDSSLALTLRMTGTDIFYIEKPFNQQNDKFSVLDSLLKRSSEKMMEVVEPYQLAVYYNNVGQDEKALKQIRYIINNIPEEKKWAYNLWGNIYKYDGSDTGNIEKAINKYKIAYELDPNYVLPLYNLGTTYKELNRIDEAIEQLEKVIDIDPNYILAYNALSYCYLEKKDTAKALELYQVLAKVENKDEEDLNMMTNLMFALNDSTSIIKYFQQKDERGEVLSVQEYKLWSFRLYDRGYKDESIKKLKEGIDFYPDDFDMRINLIIYCVVMGNKEEALSAADELIKIDAPVRLGYLFKGYAYAVFRDIPNAKAMLDLSSKDEKIKPFNIYLEAVIAYYENDMEKFYSKLDEHLKYKASFDGLANIPPLDSLKNDTRTQEILKKYGK